MHVYTEIRFICKVLDRKNEKEHDYYKSKHEMNVYPVHTEMIALWASRTRKFDVVHIRRRVYTVPTTDQISF